MSKKLFSNAKICIKEVKELGEIINQSMRESNGQNNIMGESQIINNMDFIRFFTPSTERIEKRKLSYFLQGLREMIRKQEAD